MGGVRGLAGRKCGHVSYRRGGEAVSREWTLLISKDSLHDILVRGRRLHRIMHGIDVWLYRDGKELVVQIIETPERGREWLQGLPGDESPGGTSER